MTATNVDSKVANPRKSYECSMEYPHGMEKHVWNTLWLSVAHIFGAHGMLMLFTGEIPRGLFIFSFFHGYFAGTGITMGCHRYWAHKTFKAKLPLQILLAYMQTAAAQYPIFKWCRDHRIHHKYVETDADPHDARRGFFFAHMGWLFVKEHPAVKEKEGTIDFTDLDNDPVVRFQTKYYWHLLAISVFVVPMYLQHLIWPQLTLYQLFCANYIWYIFSLHFTWLVNSAAHLYGYRPYDKGIYPRENKLVSLLAIGEGFHNYHHSFPYDYKAAEIGIYRYNWSALFIDFFAWVGLAYDLKSVPWNTVKNRVKRTGDGSHAVYGNNKLEESEVRDVKPVWGWGDVDMTPEDYKIAEIYKPSPNPAG